MISVLEAKQKILSNLQPLEPVSVSLSEALFRVMAYDVTAPLALPLFDNSAMDGFALLSTDTEGASPEHPLRLRVVATCKAGDSERFLLESGEAIRIMTGAPIPKGADAVVAKERALFQNHEVWLKQPVPPGTNIRRQGEEISKGQHVLFDGTVLTSRHIGFLASLGLMEVKVHRPPSVGIITTGSELVSSDEALDKSLERGKIFDSNTPMLTSCLKELALEPSFTQQVPDDPKIIFNSLRDGLEASDVLLVAGGVSVGDFDYTKGVFQDLGIKEVFWGVEQKPGKPLYFGKHGEKLVFGLPGNPASVWICFYEYVRPALLRLLGQKAVGSPSPGLPLKQSLRGDLNKTLFLKGRWDPTNEKPEVLPLQGQGSHMLGSLADANCLLVIPPGKKEILEGEVVEVHPIFNGVPFYD